MSRPALLALLAAIAAPLLLHLFTRARPRRLDWAAWRFLPRPDPAESRVIRIDEPWLMALRMLAVAALAIAAAGPTCVGPVGESAQLVGIERPTFIVDLSASMGIGADGERPLDRATELLDDTWRRYRWADGVVLGCRGPELVPLYDGANVLPRRFLGLVLDAWHVGGAELGACVAGAEAGERDLVVLSDRPAPEDAANWPGRTVHWYGAGRAEPPRNHGFGRIDVELDGQTVHIAGTVDGGAGELPVRLRWRTPNRPVVETTTVDGAFRIELLAPRETGRLELAVADDDQALWDDVVPIWIPAGARPDVVLGGAFSPLAERLTMDLMYAARDRIRLLVGPSAEATGSRRVHVLYHPDPNDVAAVAELQTAVENGATVIVFALDSAESAGPQPFWVPGWLHPPQRTHDRRVRPTAALTTAFPGLVGLDWQAVEVAGIRPLADPLPNVDVLLETDQGLPLLTRTRHGRGTVYTWMIDLGPAYGNLPKTAPWAPLWLGLMGVLDERAAQGEIRPAGAPLDDLQGVRRIDTAFRAEAGDAWLGWLEGRDARGAARHIALRVPPDEREPGTASGLQPLRTAPGGAAPAQGEAVGTEPWWLALVGLLWLGQAAGAHGRQRGFWLLLAGAAALLGTPATAHAGEPEASRALQVWVPGESAPTASQLAGAEWVMAQWRRRASPEVAVEAREFAWAATDPADPWVWWLGCRAFDPAGDPWLDDKVERFVRAQGSLWVEACGGPADVRRTAERIAAWAAGRGLVGGWRALPADHVLHRTFYLLDGWRDPEGVGEIWGLNIDGHDRLLLVPNMARALAREPLAGWDLNLGEDAREWIVRQGMNMLMYITTYDYKNDSIHLPYILERRRRHR